MTYHNTTAAEGEELRWYQRKADTQEGIIAAWYQAQEEWGTVGFTPSKVHKAAMPQAPLTSVRRALSDLAKAGVLVKTNEQRIGPYGRPESVYRLAAPVQGKLI